MQPAVVGATGRTGVPLVEQALEHGHSVAAPTRSREKPAIEHERVDMVVGDPYTHEGVRETDLRWTVLRPPRLTDACGRGNYRVEAIVLGSESVAQADVATCILDIADDGLYTRGLPRGGPS